MRKFNQQNGKENQGYSKRVEGEPPGPGQFAPVYYIITEKGKQLLLSQLG